MGRENVCMVILSVCGKHWRALTALTELFCWLGYNAHPRPVLRHRLRVCATARALGHEVVSLDNALPADIECDVHEWDHTVYKPGHFDVVCASPPCAVWSNARLMNVGQFCKRTGGVWTKEMLEVELQGVHGAMLVEWMREILDYFHPTFYWIENPWLSRMRDYIVDLPCVCRHR